MANNQDKGGDQTRSTGTNAGQQGGQGSAGDMTDRQKGGQRPEDKTDKDWAQSQDTGRQGGQSVEQPDERENLSDTGKAGGQQRDKGPGIDKER